MRLSTLVMGAFFALLSVTPALALAPCGQVVVDQANLIGASSENRITTTARSLEETMGITVRVRTSNYQSNQYIKDLAETSCDAWGGAEFVTIWIVNSSNANERGMGVYRSPRIQGVITTAEAEGIAQEHIVPTMRTDPADGIIAAFDAVETQLRPVFGGAETVVADRAPSSTTIGRGDLDQRTDSTPVVSEPERQTLPVSYMIGSFLLLILTLGILYWVFTRYARNRAAREEVKGVLAECYGEFDGLNGPAERLVRDYFGTDEEPKQAPAWANAGRFVRWKAQFAAITDRAGGANDQFLSVETGPMNEAGTIDEYAQVAANLRLVLSELQTAAAELAALEAEISHEFALSEELSQMLDDGKTYIADKKKAVEAVEQTGFIVTSMLSEMQNASVSLTTARAAFGDKRYSEAERSLQEARQTAETAAASAAGLAEWKSQLQQQWDDLRHTCFVQLQRAETTRVIFQGMRTRFADESLRSVKGNGSEAEKRLYALEVALTSVDEHFTAQRWSQVEGQLDTIAAKLDEVEELLDSVVELERMLEQAKVDAAAEVEEAERSVTLARQYLRRHAKHATVARDNDLNQAVRLIADARRELSQTLPDYPVAFKAAAKADDLADSVYDGAVEDQAELERRIARAERRRTEVVNRIAEAQRYKRLHNSDLDWSTRREIDDLSSALIMLQSASHHDDILRQAKQLEEAAERAHDRAIREFRAAESDREDARRAQARQDETVGWGSSSSDDDETISWGSSSSDDDETVGW